MIGWSDWTWALRFLADADDADPAAAAPAEVIDGGPWRGPDLEAWLERFRRRTDPRPTYCPNVWMMPRGIVTWPLA